MAAALYVNGVFEKVLVEIIAAQSRQRDLVCMLQPYSGEKIKLLAESPPSPGQPVVLYISVTTSLDQVSYRANIVGWSDKRSLDSTERVNLNARIRQHQPSEKEVYLAVNGRECVNLLFVRELERLPSPVSVSCFTKLSDRAPLRPRTRAGGWSYVDAQTDWLGRLPSIVENDLARNLADAVAKASADSSQQRALRLAAASPKPAQVQVITRAFRRNPDVIAEVMFRAAGRCEKCHALAPFARASDGSPYLEVHHRIQLANGGDDTVDNALALCPNCHRERHFGKGET